MRQSQRSNDPKAVDAQVMIRDFAGWVSNVDPHDIPPGTAISQSNAVSLRPGELRVRNGSRVVRFD